MQKTAFLSGEGDAYFERNTAPFNPGADPVVSALKDIDHRCTSILEVGCGRGERLAFLSKAYAANGSGVDPSPKAIAFASSEFKFLQFKVGTADLLDFPKHSFDLLIFGFCLYLCDPEDHFLIAAEADRVLKDDGLLVIYDFFSPRPYKNQYKHRDGINSHKMAWSDMFTAHPSYRLMSRRYAGKSYATDDSVTVDVLRKSASFNY